MLNFYIVAFLADLALGAVLLSVPLFLIYRFDSSAFTLGLFGALGAVVYSVGVAVSGAISDRMNRKWMLITGCIIFILAYFTISWSQKIGITLIIYAFGSVSMSMFWPVLQSWISQGLNKHELMKALTIFNVSWSGGLMCGFLSAGLLFSINYRLPFLLAAAFIAAVIVILRKQPLCPVNVSAKQDNTLVNPDDFRPDLAVKFLIIAWCANFASWFIMGVVRNIFPKLGIDLGFSSFVIGAIIFVMTLAQTVMFLILGKTHSWHYRLDLLVICQLLSIISLIFVGFVSSAIHFFTAMVFLGLTSGLTYFSSIFYSLHGVKNKGRQSGLHESFLGAGALFGPLAGGFVAKWFGIRAPYFMAAALVFLLIGAEIIIYKKVKNG